MIMSPPLTSPAAQSQVSWSRFSHPTPSVHLLIHSPTATSYGDVSSGIGDLNLDTMLDDLDLKGPLMTPNGLQVASNYTPKDIQPTAVCVEGNCSSGTALNKNVDGNHPFACPSDSACSTFYEHNVDGGHPAAGSFLSKNVPPVCLPK